MPRGNDKKKIFKTQCPHWHISRDCQRGRKYIAVLWQDDSVAAVEVQAYKIAINVPATGYPMLALVSIVVVGRCRGWFDKNGDGPEDEGLPGQALAAAHRGERQQDKTIKKETTRTKQNNKRYMVPETPREKMMSRRTTQH